MGCKGEESVFLGLLQLAYGASGTRSDELLLVLENRKRLSENSLEGETPAVIDQVAVLYVATPVTTTTFWWLY
ncbi:hypothetical protein U1Q18_020626 [Sarracenia purpurea var. burkii]